jgi:hypothetical protein
MKSKFLYAAFPLLTWQGFIDSYYLYDANPHDSAQRVYTTQAIKDHTFSVNLMMLGARAETSRTHTQLTLQKGDSVDSNYIAEVHQGDKVKFLQEAYFGYKLENDWWIDGGIFLGHIGNESWISKDNWTYTRSMQLDYVPYYASGVRVSGNQWQFHLLNGWQNINENNQGKAIGFQYVWNFPSWVLTSNSQVGHEPFLIRKTSGTRVYQNTHALIVRERLDWKGAFDIGSQNVPSEKRAWLWWAASSQWRYKINSKQNASFRLEYFHDHKGAIAPTGTNGGFRVFGTSLNHDIQWNKSILTRVELKHLQATDKIYPQENKVTSSDNILVMSLGLSL